MSRPISAEVSSNNITSKAEVAASIPLKITKQAENIPSKKVGIADSEIIIVASPIQRVQRRLYQDMPRSILVTLALGGVFIFVILLWLIVLSDRPDMVNIYKSSWPNGCVKYAEIDKQQYRVAKFFVRQKGVHVCNAEELKDDDTFCYDADSFAETFKLSKDDDATKTVYDWLKSFAEIDEDTKEKHYGAVIKANATIQTWESMLHTNFVVQDCTNADPPLYNFGQEDAPMFETGVYKTASLPKKVADATVVIYGLWLERWESYAAGIGKLSTQTLVDSLNTINPYNMPDKLSPSLYQYNGTNEVTMAFLPINSRYLDQKSIARFKSEYGIEAQTVELLNNNVVKQYDVGQWMQYAIATAPNINHKVINPITGTFNAFVDAIIGSESVDVYVIPSIYERFWRKEHLLHINELLGRLTHRKNAPVVVATAGDYGVAGSSAFDNKNACGYKPMFPASSPYVIAVGGSQGLESSNAPIACSASTGAKITTGGGFSDNFAMPKWQKGFADKSWVAEDFTSSGKRGYPDLTLPAVNYVTANRLEPASVWDSTFYSTFVFAGWVANIMAYRKENSMPSLTKPLLQMIYANHLELNFTDITSGNNKCTGGCILCETCCDEGFTASVGWDPVTGFGDANLTALFDFFTAQ